MNVLDVMDGITAEALRPDLLISFGSGLVSKKIKVFFQYGDRRTWVVIVEWSS